MVMAGTAAGLTINGHGRDGRRPDHKWSWQGLTINGRCMLDFKGSGRIFIKIIGLFLARSQISERSSKRYPILEGA